jgi:hypothetical protein
VSVIVPEMQSLFTINSGAVQSTAPELIFFWSVAQGPHAKNARLQNQIDRLQPEFS